MSDIGRRLVFVGRDRVEVESFEVPEPGPGQVLVRVHRSQVSAGTEKNAFLAASSSEHRREWGYTTAGYVLATGPGMEQFKPGDRVIAMAFHASHCLVGAPPGAPFRGNWDYPPQPIEHDITDDQAAFTVLSTVALHAIRRAQIQIDESVAVFGQGVVGQLVTAFCRIAGAYPIIAVDLDEERLTLAEKSGATHVVDASKQDAAEAVRAITGDGAECVFHATRIPSTLVDCMGAAADRGKVVIPGFPPGSADIDVMDGIVRRELDIRGVYAGEQENNPHPYWPWTRYRSRKAAMRLIASGDLKVDHLISHVCKPEEANDIYQQILAGPKGWMSVFFDWESEPV